MYQTKQYNLYGWDAQDSILNYNMVRRFYNDSTTKGNLEDKVTILNVPAIVSFFNLKSSMDIVQQYLFCFNRVSLVWQKVKPKNMAAK